MLLYVYHGNNNSWQIMHGRIYLICTKQMRRCKKRCHCKKCVLKLEVTNSLGELIPGPQGPMGPTGRVIAETPRSLKVQLMGTEIVPVINQGFLWETDVLPPPGFPVPGTFTFYRATVLDQEGFSVAEMFNSNGGINHTQVDEIHTSTLAHYRNGVLQDLHSVSSQVPGAQNFLLAQTLHDVVINDQLYFAISPNVSSLTSFNYTLGSIKMKPSVKFSPPTPGNLSAVAFPLIGYPAGQTFCAVATSDFSEVLLPSVFSSAAAGGGGAGQESTNDGGGAKIGRGGGGGGAGFVTGPAGAPWPTTLNKGDIIEVFIGLGGAGGTSGDSDGKPGQESSIKLNGTLVMWNPMDPSTFLDNPIAGGFGGQGGVNGGKGADANGCATGGGGGGAPLTDGVPGTPGSGGAQGCGFAAGQDGGIDPRTGGLSGDSGAPPFATILGGVGGTSIINMGSGGGGAGFVFFEDISQDVGKGGDGGAPGLPGQIGADGQGIRNTNQPSEPPSALSVGGGGGGSGGLPSFGGTPVPGGDGGKGSDYFISLTSFNNS